MKKYTDVDIIAELQRLVDSHVDSFKECDIDSATVATDFYGRISGPAFDNDIKEKT